MKKILLVAAMAVAFAAPPAMAADKGDSDETNMIVKCTILPLLPECIEFWTAKAEEAAAKAEDMAASIADSLS